MWFFDLWRRQGKPKQTPYDLAQSYLDRINVIIDEEVSREPWRDIDSMLRALDKIRERLAPIYDEVGRESWATRVSFNALSNHQLRRGRPPMDRPSDGGKCVEDYCDNRAHPDTYQYGGRCEECDDGALGCSLDGHRHG